MDTGNQGNQRESGGRFPLIRSEYWIKWKILFN